MSDQRASDLTIRQQIDAAAYTRPDAPFLISPEGITLSFRDLQTSGRALEARFRELGLEPGDHVALGLENGLLAVQWLLGAMYSGRVPIPLNLDGGKNSLVKTLAHSGTPPVVISRAQESVIRSAAEAIDGGLSVVLTDGEEMIGHSCASTAGTVPQPGDPALICYTSGTTGTPKGALHTQRSLSHSALNTVQAHALSSSDRGMLVVPLCHVNAITVTVLPTLYAGGSILVVPRFDARTFVEHLSAFECTWCALVPTHIAQLLALGADDNAREKMRNLRFLRSSSGPLAPAKQEAFIQAFQVPLLQGMGCTEAGNVFSNPQPPAANKIGSVGRPFGFELKIVSRDGTALPGGKTGTVCIRGPAMMKEYFRDPQGTRAAIDREGWLHLGDLGWIDPDGDLFITGRIREIAIKGGVNIALREIDEVLEAHPAVLEAATVGMPDSMLGDELEAFVVLNPGRQFDAPALLEYCEERVGPFKTPARIAVVTNLPRGPSGKIQRRKLLEHSPVVPPCSVVASVSVSTSAITSIWAGVLSLDAVGEDDDFFSLGGSSLQAVESLVRLRRQVSSVVPVSLSDVYACPTPRRLAEQVNTKLNSGERESAVGLSRRWARKKTGGYSFPLTQAQSGLLFTEMMTPEDPLLNESEGVFIRGPLDLERLREAFERVVARHELMQSTIDFDPDEPRAVVRPGTPLQFEVAEADNPDLWRKEIRKRFVLESAPGLRVVVTPGAAGTTVLVLMHHVVSDRASFGNLWREVTETYTAIGEGRPPRVSELPWQFSDYAEWVNARAATERYQQSLAYWQEQLRGLPDRMTLPTGAADSQRSFCAAGAKLHVRIPVDLADRARALSRQFKVSVYALFAAVLGVLLHRLSGRQDLVIGIPISDRELPEMQPIIGYLVGLHALRIDFSGEPSFAVVLHQVRHRLEELAFHRSATFFDIINACGLSGSSQPLIQVTLNWRERNHQMSFIGLDGLELEPVPLDAGTAKYDLGLTMTDVGAGSAIWFDVQYRTNLFLEFQVQKWMAHLQAILTAVCARTDRAISELP